jgi:hypothetical protein
MIARPNQNTGGGEIYDFVTRSPNKRILHS